MQSPYFVLTARRLHHSFWKWLSVAAVVGSTGACSNGTPESSDMVDGTGTSAEQASAALGVACGSPSENCPCDDDGLTVACKGPQIHVGDYTSCLPGVRVCMSGSWGACAVNTLYQNVDAVTQDYTSPCSPGTRVRWGALTIQGLTPDGSQVDVGAQTSDTLSGLDAAPSELVGAFDGDVAAPWKSIDVGAALATNGVASGQMLRITLRLVRAPQSSASPSIMSWQQASACVPE